MISLDRIYRHPYLFLLLWSIPILFLGLLSDQSIIAHDEGLYATRARFMFDTGDWINPWQIPHHKTPGIYWLIASSYRLFGINEIALRIPNLLISLGCVFLVYQITINLFHLRIALLAASILSLEFLWLRYSYLANPDHITVFLFLLSIFFLVKYESILNEDANKSNFKFTIQPSIYLLFLGIFLGLMILFRGFMAFIPLFCIGIYLIKGNSRYSYLKQYLLYVGLVIGLLPILFWIFSSFQRYEWKTLQSLFDSFFRLSQEKRRDHGLFFYTWNTLGLCFPWIIFAGFGFVNYLRSKNNYKFLIIGIPSFIFVIISLYSTRLSHYALMLYPFIAILAALGIDDLLERQSQFKWKQKCLQVISYLLGLLGGITVLMLIVVLFCYIFRIELFNVEILNIFYIFVPLSIAWAYLGLLGYSKKFSQRWLATLLVGHWLTFLFLVQSGLLTNINDEIKSVLAQAALRNTIEQQSIGIIGGGKTEILLKFYLPSVNYQVTNIKDLTPIDYAWVENKYLKNQVIVYRSLARFEDWTFIQRQS